MMLDAMEQPPAKPMIGRRLAFVVVPATFFIFIAVALFGKASPLVAGEQVPDFRAKDFSGRQVRLSDFRGRPVFLNFWASWCIPCQQEAPDLALTYQRYKDTDLVMLGVNSEDLFDEAKEFRAEYKLDFLSVRDGPGEISKQIFGVRKYPETLLIDRHGVLVEHIYGPMSAADMNAKIDRLLARP